MRLSNIFRLSPLAETGPASLSQLVLAAAPWAVLAVLAVLLLAR